MEGLGTHIIAELFNCNEFHINDINKVEEVLTAAAELSNATIIKPFFHKFSPYGISGVVVIAESHITIHTWPEHSYAAVDVFTCGEHNYRIAIDYITEKLGAERCSIYQFQRGMLERNETMKGILVPPEVENVNFIE